VRLAAKLLGWKIDIKSEEEKRQEVEQQMQALSGGPTTPIEQVTELGDTILQKLVAAGITTVEGLADMTPEQLEEIPGIGEKTLEKISVAVRHYFGDFEEGAEGETAEGEKPEAVEENGEEEIPEASAVVNGDKAEAENSAEVLEEAEGVEAVETDADSVSADETAVEDAPVAEDAQEEVAMENEAAEKQSDTEQGA
jgi:N utilization substance protein A